MIFFLKHFLVQVLWTMVVIGGLGWWAVGQPYFLETIQPWIPYRPWIGGAVLIFLISRSLDVLEVVGARIVSWILIGGVLSGALRVFASGVLEISHVWLWYGIGTVVMMIAIALIPWKVVRWMTGMGVVCMMLGYGFWLIPVYDIPVVYDQLRQDFSPRMIISEIGTTEGQLMVVTSERSFTKTLENLTSQDIEWSEFPISLEYSSSTTGDKVIYISLMPEMVVKILPQSSVRIVLSGSVMLTGVVGGVVTGDISTFPELLGQEQQRFGRVLDQIFVRPYQGKTMIEKLVEYKLQLLSERYPLYREKYVQWQRYQYLKGNSDVSVPSDLKSFQPLIVPIQQLPDAGVGNMWEGMLSDPWIVSVKKWMGQIFSW